MAGTALLYMGCMFYNTMHASNDLSSGEDSVWCAIESAYAMLRFRVRVQVRVRIHVQIQKVGRKRKIGMEIGWERRSTIISTVELPVRVDVKK